MKTVVLCNALEPLKAYLKSIEGPLRYLNLVESRESREICDFLEQRPNTQELPRAHLFRERSKCFRQKYIDFMGRVNAQNDSLLWWSMPVTDKSRLSSDLCRNIFYFLLITELVRAKEDPLLVVTDSTELVAQVNVWTRKEGIRLLTAVGGPKGLREKFRRFLKTSTPAGIAYSFLKTVYLWTQCRRYKPAANKKDAHLVIHTLTHLRSFSEHNGYRDAYYAPLIDHVAGSGQRVLLFGLMLGRPTEQLEKLRALDYGVPLIPLEACLTFKSLVLSALQALRFEQ